MWEMNTTTSPSCVLGMLPIPGLLYIISLYQMTPLHLAAKKDRGNVVNCLGGNEAIINIRDLDGVKKIMCITCDCINERLPSNA